MSTVIEASSVKVQTMADSTLRLVVDIEPRFAQAAFALFGMAGTPMALAALKTQKAGEPPTPSPVKGGELAKLAGIWCHSKEFGRWINSDTTYKVENADDAASVIRDICGIESRAFLDNNDDAASVFHEYIRLPYMKWRVTQGLTA